MTCEEAVHTLDAYVDRQLEAGAVAVIRSHLAGCPACRARAADREALGGLIRRAPYYVAQVAVAPGALGDLRMTAGMPAEVFIRTDTRTALDYLLAPVTNYLRRAMREPL